MSTNKKCGTDGINNGFIKCSPLSVLELIVKLFNTILYSGVVPSDWCIGAIKPLYKKKGSIDNPDNYRGITLLSCLGKLFTSLINNRLNIYLEETNLLGIEQAGFRDGFSTLDHIFTLHCLIDLYLHKKKIIYCCFIYYRKAFD